MKMMTIVDEWTRECMAIEVPLRVQIGEKSERHPMTDSQRAESALACATLASDKGYHDLTWQFRVGRPA